MRAEGTSHAFEGKEGVAVTVQCQFADSYRESLNSAATMSDRDFWIVLEQAPGREVGLKAACMKVELNHILYYTVYDSHES